MKAFRRIIDGLVYRTASTDERAAIWKLMAQEMYPKTPLFQHLGSVSAEDVSVEFVLTPGLLEQGVSLVVEDPSTKELIGARISAVVPRDKARRHPLVADPALGAKYPKSSTIYRAVDQVASPVDIYSYYNVHTVFKSNGMVVKQAMRSCNLAKNLIDCSVQVARDHGAPVMTGITAHMHSQNMLDSKGFDRLNSVQLADYVDPLNGGKPFERLDPAVLKEIVLFAKRIA